MTKYIHHQDIPDILGYVVNVHDAVNYDIDLFLDEELRKRYWNVITNTYTYQDEDLNSSSSNPHAPMIGTTYRCRLKGIGINQSKRPFWNDKKSSVPQNGCAQRNCFKHYRNNYGRPFRIYFGDHQSKSYKHECTPENYEDSTKEHDTVSQHLTDYNGTNEDVPTSQRDEHFNIYNDINTEKNSEEHPSKEPVEEPIEEGEEEHVDEPIEEGEEEPVEEGGEEPVDEPVEEPVEEGVGKPVEEGEEEPVEEGGEEPIEEGEEEPIEEPVEEGGEEPIEEGEEEPIEEPVEEGGEEPIEEGGEEPIEERGEVLENTKLNNNKEDKSINQPYVQLKSKGCTQRNGRNFFKSKKHQDYILKDAHISMIRQFDRQNGWVLCTISDVDIYRRLLVTLYDPITRKDISSILLAPEYGNYFRPYNPCTNQEDRKETKEISK